jgi:hypothetical protein
VTNAIAGHHGAATRLALAPVSSSYPTTSCGGAAGGAASRPASDTDHQGEQAAEDGSNEKPQAHGENPRKDGCRQIGADTLREGVWKHRCVRVRVHAADVWSALRRATVILQRQGEAEKAPGHSAATKHEVAQAPSNHSALSRAQCHRFVIGRVFGVLN